MKRQHENWPRCARLGSIARRLVKPRFLQSPGSVSLEVQGDGDRMRGDGWVEERVDRGTSGPAAQCRTLSAREERAGVRRQSRVSRSGGKPVRRTLFPSWFSVRQCVRSWAAVDSPFRPPRPPPTPRSRAMSLVIRQDIIRCASRSGSLARHGNKPYRRARRPRFARFEAG